jgi:hypothetical protein
MKKQENIEEKSDLGVIEYKEQNIKNYWEKWMIFKKKNSKDWQIELKKHLPPYFDSTVNKINDFSMRENASYPPCPQEFFEVLLNGIILRNELGLFKSKYNFYFELQQYLNEFLRIFFFRFDSIIDIFQTITKFSVSKEKYPKIAIRCSNCNVHVFINVHCLDCKNEFYCDTNCRKIHSGVHKFTCNNENLMLPKIIDPIRIEIHISSQHLGEEIYIYNEYLKRFSLLMKGKILLGYLYKTLRKDRWFRNNKYNISENISDNYILIKRDKITENSNEIFCEKKEFLYRLDNDNHEQYKEDDYRDLLKLSALQELKHNFFKLGSILVDILRENNVNYIKYCLIFSFP